MVMIKLHAALPTSYTCFKTASSSCLAALCPRLLLGGRGKHVDLLQNHQNETHRDNALDEFRFVIESAGMKQPSKRNSSSWGYQDVLFRKELYRTMAHTHTHSSTCFGLSFMIIRNIMFAHVRNTCRTCLRCFFAKMSFMKQPCVAMKRP